MVMARVVQSVDEDGTKITGTVNDADNFYHFIADAIKRDVTLHRKAPKSQSKFIAGAACKGSG